MSSAADAAKVVVAYEPVWAIGTGRVATPDDAQEVCAALRVALAELYGQEIADGVRILYGGSVKSGNVAEIVGSRTSTARWSVARAWTRPSSPPSLRTRWGSSADLGAARAPNATFGRFRAGEPPSSTRSSR